MSALKPLRVIISGGGTGGHIFPAISIANAIKERWSDAEILFVGAENRMEMERVPAAGYTIVGLPVAGFDRKNLLKNVSVAVKLLKSMRKARAIVASFKPDIAVGVGGYASGPTLRAAAAKGVPTVLQEQNSYAGVTNKMLAQKAAKICVAYEGMERFFPKEKIVLTGNPTRQDLVVSEENRYPKVSAQDFPKRNSRQIHIRSYNHVPALRFHYARNRNSYGLDPVLRKTEMFNQ